MKVLKRINLLFVIFLFVFCVSLVNAENSYKSETMIVTADKRAKNIQDIPGSVSALNDLQIKDSGIFSLKDIHNYIPNFSTFQNYSAAGYQSIRGQNNVLQPSVGIYIDDVPATFGYTGVETNLFDLERVEVLRGPQGNLYGMNSAGGVINIITRKPDNSLRVSAGTEYGNYNSRAYKASLSGSIIENKLFAGISGVHRVRDSYIDEIGEKDNKEKRMAGRFQLRWFPTERTDVLFTEAHDDYNTDFDPWVLPAYSSTKIKPRGEGEGDDIRDNTYSLRVKHKASLFDITSITAYVDNDKYMSASKDFYSGGDNLKYRIMEGEDKQFIQEIRLSSNSKDSNLQWLVGGFYGHRVEETLFNMRKNTGTPGAPTAVYTDDLTTSECETDTFSVFGQADFIFFDRLTLTAGLRYDYDKKETDFYHNNNGQVKADYDDSVSWARSSPKVALNYRFNESVMAYMSAAQGYKAGGYHSVIGDTADAAMFDPEYSWSYETGIKTNFYENRVIANISAFYSTVDDIQIMYVDPNTFEFAFRNAAEATIWGVEVESVLKPVPNLNVIASFGLLETEFEEHKIKDYEGNKIPFAPEYDASLVLQYSFYSGVYLRGEGTWQGKNYFGEDNKFSQSSYTLANAKIGYDSGKLDISIFANNIFDETYYTMYNTARGGVEKAITGAPLNCGVQLEFRF